MNRVTKRVSILILSLVIIAVGCLFFNSANKMERAYASVGDEYFYNGKEDDLSLEDLRKTPVEEIMAMPAYNSQNYGIITTAISQGAKPTCWAHALAASSEASILREGLTDKTNKEFRLSSDNIAYINFNRTKSNDPLNNTSDDLWTQNWLQGSLNEDAVRRISQWNGPITVDYNKVENGATYFATPEFLLEDYVFIDPDDTEGIKRAIATYGAVTTDFDISMSPSTKFYNSQGVAGTGLHAVSIVGWNDDIPVSLFTDGNGKQNSPKKKGGWLIKNSWGKTYSHDGFFFLSYESRIGTAVAYDYAKYDENRHNYYYDGRNMNTDKVYYNTDAGVIFRGKCAKDSVREFLDSVNVEVVGENITIDVEVYLDGNVNFGNKYSAINIPENGTLVSQGKRTVRNSGAYTVDLKNKVEIKNDQIFSLVVKLSSPIKSPAVALSFEPSSYNDMTYLKKDGIWQNTHLLGDGVAKIRAFTHTESTENVDVMDLKNATIIPDKTSITMGLSERTPLYSVKFNGKNLVEGRDYLLAMRPFDKTNSSCNELVDWVEVTVMGVGDYTGYKKEFFQVVMGDNPDVASFGKVDGLNNIIKMNVGSEINSLKDIVLPDGWHFISPSTKLETGKNTARIYYEGKNKNYLRKLTFKVEITKGRSDTTPISLSTFRIGGESTVKNYKYTGYDITPYCFIYTSSENLKYGEDYGYSYENNRNVGKAKMTFYGRDIYSGTKVFEYNITQADNGIYEFYLDDGKVVANSLFGEVKYKYYNDVSCVDEVTNPVENNTYYIKPYVEETENFKGVSVDSTKEPLSATYKAPVKAEEKIIKKAESRTMHYYYSGFEKAPDLVVYDSNSKIVDETNYDITYSSDIIDADFITYVVRGKGDYAGIVTGTYEIEKGENEIKEFKYLNGRVKAKAKYGVPEVKFYLDEQCKTETDMPMPTDYGTYYMKATVEGNSNYTSCEKVVKVVLEDESIKPDPIIPDPDINPDDKDNPDDTVKPDGTVKPDKKEEKGGCFGALESDITLVAIVLIFCGIVIGFKRRN